MRVADSNFARAAVATSWNYSGRLVGLGWTALLISTLGIADYGTYAIGIAAAAIINAVIDNAFLVRSLRVDDESFQRERCARVLFGTAVAAIGVATYPLSYIAGFAIIVAAGELLFNTFKSQYMRSGNPDVAMRFDAIRQFTSIGLAAGYLLLATDPQLSAATGFYVAPYCALVVVCLRYVPGRKPMLPGGLREIATLSSEAFAYAIYSQGDLLVLGTVVGEKLTGYYSVALVAALAVSTIGQHYATTFIERLRASSGALHAAPGPANVVKVALLTGGAMASIGLGVLVWGRADEVGYLALIMSAWVAARAIQYNLVVILFIQHRDALRVKAMATVAAVKIALLIPVSHHFGLYGAAATAVFCELALISVYYYLIFRRPPRVESSSGPTTADHGGLPS